jgi:hypothetical protein
MSSTQEIVGDTINHQYSVLGSKIDAHKVNPHTGLYSFLRSWFISDHPDPTSILDESVESKGAPFILPAVPLNKEVRVESPVLTEYNTDDLLNYRHKKTTQTLKVGMIKWAKQCKMKQLKELNVKQKRFQERLEKINQEHQKK